MNTDICNIILSYNGTDAELETEKGLRWLFLTDRKKFIWPHGSRKQTLHLFFEFYQVPLCHGFVNDLLKGKPYTPPNWATSNDVRRELLGIDIK